MKFGGLGHTAVIHARDEARIRQFGLHVPAMRVPVSTSAPAESYQFDIKRLAYEVRKPEEALKPRRYSRRPLPPEHRAGAAIAAAAERYVAARSVAVNAVSASLPPAWSTVFVRGHPGKPQNIDRTQKHRDAIRPRPRRTL